MAHWDPKKMYIPEAVTIELTLQCKVCASSIRFEGDSKHLDDWIALWRHCHPCSERWDPPPELPLTKEWEDVLEAHRKADDNILNDVWHPKESFLRSLLRMDFEEIYRRLKVAEKDVVEVSGPLENYRHDIEGLRRWYSKSSWADPRTASSGQ